VIVEFLQVIIGRKTSCSSKRNRLVGSCISTLVSSTNSFAGRRRARLLAVAGRGLPAFDQRQMSRCVPRGSARSARHPSRHGHRNRHRVGCDRRGCRRRNARRLSSALSFAAPQRREQRGRLGGGLATASVSERRREWLGTKRACGFDKNLQRLNKLEHFRDVAATLTPRTRAQLAAAIDDEVLRSIPRTCLPYMFSSS